MRNKSRMALAVLLLAAVCSAVAAGAYIISGRYSSDPHVTPGRQGIAGADVEGLTAGGHAVALAGSDQATPAPVVDDNAQPADASSLPEMTVKDPGGTAAVDSSVSQLANLAETAGTAAAADFALSRGMDISGDNVTLVIQSGGGSNSPMTSPPGDIADVEAAAARHGARVEAAAPGLVQVSVPIESVKSLAAEPAVGYIRVPYRPTPSGVGEGVADVGADVWQAAGHDGSGVKLAILDLGFSGYDQRIIEGELPADVITASFRVDGDITAAGEVHGTACAEIAHDMAPGSQLYLVNFSTDVELANAVDYLKAEGVDIVSASWSFFSSFRGDGQGPIDDIVRGAVESGIFWANAAGNAARSHWSASFSDADADSWGEFAPGDEGNDIYASSGSRIDVYLTWDRWPATDQDYDLYLFWSGNPNNPVAASEGWQGGTQQPTEEIHYVVPPGHGGTYWVGIYNYSSTADATFKLYTPQQDLQYQVPQGSLGGQPSDSPYVMTVGATPVGATTLETFSSQGPTVDGRTKPDIVAPDRVSTSSYGITGFWGTSASAPHTAGAAALVLGVWPGWSPSQVQSDLESRAVDLGISGKDDLFGAGKLNLAMPPDTQPPLITSVEPTGVIYTTDAVVKVYYEDSGSGIDQASVDITLDGVSLSGCVINQASAACGIYGLEAGPHVVGGTVADLAGNTAPVSGSFEVLCSRPSLALGSPQPFWASYADYQAGLLSVTFSFCNNGSNAASNIQLAGSVNTSGVILVTPVPYTIGDIAAGACLETTFQYLVPPGVSVFKSTVYVTAGDPCGLDYAYPGPLF